MIEGVAKILLNEGFCFAFKIIKQQEKEQNFIEIELKYKLLLKIKIL